MVDRPNSVPCPADCPERDALLAERSECQRVAADMTAQASAAIRERDEAVRARDDFAQQLMALESERDALLADPVRRFLAHRRAWALRTINEPGAGRAYAEYGDRLNDEMLMAQGDTPDEACAAALRALEAEGGSDGT